MTEEQKAAMLHHPIRSICKLVVAGAAGLMIAYVTQTYGFPWLGGWEWQK